MVCPPPIGSGRSSNACRRSLFGTNASRGTVLRAAMTRGSRMPRASTCRVSKRSRLLILTIVASHAIGIGPQHSNILCSRRSSRGGSRPRSLCLWRLRHLYARPLRDGDDFGHIRPSPGAHAGLVQLPEHPLDAGAGHATYEHASLDAACVAERMLLAARTEEGPSRAELQRLEPIGAVEGDFAGQYIE